LFDLTIFPLSISSGREQYDLPGLLVISAPRKVERLRANDLLVLYMRLAALSGSSAVFTHAQQKEILSRLAETYFTSSGSVTAGMRATALRLNEFILNRNLKAVHEGQTIAILNMAVAHGNHLILSHNGATHSFFLSQEKVQHFDDGQGMRGLGISRQVTPHFYQMSLSPNDMVVLCPEPPETWSQSLAGSPSISFEGLHRRLVNNIVSDLQVVALRFSAGEGQISFWRPATTRPAPALSTAEQSRVIQESLPIKAGISTPVASIAPPDQLPGKEQTVSSISPPKVTPLPKPRPDYGGELRARLAGAWKTGSQVRAKVGEFTGRMFPRRAEPLVSLSPSALLLIAILVPVMVVTVATTVYFRAGRTEQFAILLDQAETYAQQAADQTDPQLQKQAWMSVNSLLEEAEKYGKSEESRSLRREALAALDGLQGVSRLDFQPALTNTLGSDVNITRMIATLNQVYLLDSNQGRILSLTRNTSGGYEINQAFSCSPEKVSTAIVGPLIDLAELPINNENRADIMGIDDTGNLVYCSSGTGDTISMSLALPDAGWGSLTGITTYGDTLYVLDPKMNAVYVYYGEKGVYAGKPHLYFGSDIPVMTDVIDLAVDQEFLYLLHADGRMTLCSSGGVSYGNTRCTDPAPYGDPRAGMEPAPLAFPGAQFSQIQTTQPPDPSLFALDGVNQALYHLSQRRMNLQRLYMNNSESDFPFPDKEATAFAVTPNRRILLAFGNQIFLASLP